MKFKVILTVATEKEGLELLAEYARLGFPEEHRTDAFNPRTLSVEVSRGFAEDHKQLFSETNTHYLPVDLSKTAASDWEDWGSTGYVLSQESIDESRVEELL